MMKQKILFFIISLAAWQGMVWGEESACTEEKLHPFWAQEYTGADLLREKLQESTQWEVADHLFQIWDTYFLSHGEYVSNLIASPHPSAPIPLKKPINYTELDDLNQKSEHYDSFIRCQEENSCPAYINISMYLEYLFPLSDQGLNVANLIDRTNMVVVVAAGNDETLMNPIEQKYARQKDIIAVGNCGTDGNPSSSSSHAPEITVCAPSSSSDPNGGIRSYNFEEEPITFGGTSGSAPQVTGALVAFTAITGYYLNSREAIKLLQKTATPHPLLPTQSNMGAGMLNTWKIGEVAFKLRELCQENKTCYADSLQSEDTFKFSVDKQSLIEQISDMEKENLLKDLRKAALLSSFDGELWSLLASINRKKCLEKQAQYYQSLANRVEKTNRELLYELEETGQYSMLKYLSFSNKEIKEDLTKLYLSILRKEEGIDREALIELFNTLIDNEEFALIQQKSFWEMFINHSKIDGEILKEIGKLIIFNATNIPEHEKLLLAIINHEKIDRTGLELFIMIIFYYDKNILNHEQLFQAIANREKLME